MNVLDYICVHDPRSPYFNDLHYYDEPEDLPEPRGKCFCDNCFYGRDKLAIEIIRLKGELNHV